MNTKVQRMVALKVYTAEASFRKASIQEIDVLRDLADPGHEGILTPLEEFELEGPNGTHRCYTMAPATEGHYTSIHSTEMMRTLCGRLALAVAYIHSRGYVHGDIHIDNTLAKLQPSFCELSIEQYYEEHGYLDAVSINNMDHDGEPISELPLPPNVPPEIFSPNVLWDVADVSDAHILLRHFSEAFVPGKGLAADCRTTSVSRPPEAPLDPQSLLSYPADIWSMATVIWEIIGSRPLFSNNYWSVKDLSSPRPDVPGARGLPEAWWQNWTERSEYYEDDRRPIDGRELRPPPLEISFAEGVQNIDKSADSLGLKNG
ncbi:kinase-like domain-containing protein [Aspergillus multicolor]|uniref:kinase-like domain-containing protein n=1 Tax=Aspergillus multicolor TaxID=41759 RepID=UPI003CCD397B